VASWQRWDGLSSSSVGALCRIQFILLWVGRSDLLRYFRAWGFKLLSTQTASENARSSKKHPSKHQSRGRADIWTKLKWLRSERSSEVERNDSIELLKSRLRISFRVEHDERIATRHG